MTERKWSVSTDPDVLLESVRDRATDRQLRLFLCGCCRRLLPWLKGPRKAALLVCEKVLEVSERYADGLASDEELLGALPVSDLYRVQSGVGILAVEAARRATYLQLAGDDRPMRSGRAIMAHPASEGAEFARGVVSVIAGERKGPSGKAAKKRAATVREKAWQVHLLRDLFGSPFGPPPALRAGGGLIRGLAQAAYDERVLPEGTLNPDRLAVLADALEEAGCANANMLNHCRQPGVHVRGCWVVDLLLGKE